MISAAAAALLFAACAPTQEVRDGASFEGLTKYYIMPVSGGDSFFAKLGDRKEYDNYLYDAIKELMSGRGFENVATPEEAQFALRPIYSEWNYNTPLASDVDFRMNDMPPPGVSRTQLYLNLEIEAYLPSIEKWAWRGFSYTKLARDNMSVAVIKEQVKWCLQHFPPEKYPSNSQMKAQKEAEAAKAAKGEEAKSVEDNAEGVKKN